MGGGAFAAAAVFTLTLFNPNSDENKISLYIINTCSNIHKMRIEKVITTEDKMS